MSVGQKHHRWNYFAKLGGESGDYILASFNSEEDIRRYIRNCKADWLASGYHSFRLVLQDESSD